MENDSIIKGMPLHSGEKILKQRYVDIMEDNLYYEKHMLESIKNEEIELLKKLEELPIKKNKLLEASQERRRTHANEQKILLYMMREKIKEFQKRKSALNLKLNKIYSKKWTLMEDLTDYSQKKLWYRVGFIGEFETVEDIKKEYALNFTNSNRSLILLKNKQIPFNFDLSNYEGIRNFTSIVELYKEFNDMIKLDKEEINDRDYKMLMILMMQRRKRELTNIFSQVPRFVVIHTLKFLENVELEDYSVLIEKEHEYDYGDYGDDDQIENYGDIRGW